MIRSAFKSGIKRVFGMDAAPVAAPVPAPVWKTPVTAAPPVPAGPPAAVVELKPVLPVAVVTEAPADAAPDAAPVAAVLDVASEAGPEAGPQAAPDAAVLDTDDTAGSAFTLAAVQEIMDEMVRPALQGDGGDITLLRIENNDIYVKLVGSCSTCPSSIMTMKMGVEALLKEEFPAMNNLIQVD